MKRLLSMLALLMIFASCNSHKAASENETFEVIKQNSYGGMTEPTNLVIKSQSEIESLYKQQGWENIPVVDFKKHNVVALFLGEKTSGGYSIGVEKIETSGKTTIVYVKRSVPEKGSMSTMALTTPYCISLIPKSKNTEIKYL